MKKIIFSCFFAIFMAVVSLSVPVFGDDRPDTASRTVPKEEQDRLAAGIVKTMHEKSADIDQDKIIALREQAYREIVEKYPQADLFPDACGHLVTIYSSETASSGIEKAAAVYDDCLAKRPEPKQLTTAFDALADVYYRNGKWEQLLRLCRPAVKQFIDDGTLPRPHEMYFYSEAKYHLGDRLEAAKGYRIVVVEFPRSRESLLAEKRLAEIEEHKKDR